ncbi:MAG: L,D-transpeptidase [Chloroflexota bacterium]
MNHDSQTIEQLIKEAREAIKEGKHMVARKKAVQAITLAPDMEEPWLLLAAVSSPRASLAYLNRALEINPQSPLARRGIQWVLKRMRHNGEFYDQRRPQVNLPDSSTAFLRVRPALFPWLITVLLLATGLLYWFGFASVPVLAKGQSPRYIVHNRVKATYTPSPTPTFTPTPTPTNTPTPTPTDTPTPTSPTPKPKPTKTPKPTSIPPTPKPQNPTVNLPPGVGSEDRWVEVNLTTQRAYANIGTKRTRSFAVSTGTWLHPTVTGAYKIYVKYRYADMAGPGYYLPNVPYVMYFYKGYGLHGTYWHNNFGTPMSHGCINFTIEDAEWLFSFASVGTVVYIHP